jgi:hypothetical protein
VTLTPRSILALSLLMAACAPAPQQAQSQPDAPAHPDFSGAVENPDGPDGDRNSNTPTYTAEGEARLDAFAAQFHEIPEPGGNCVGTGVPGMMLSLVSYPIEILQTESRMFMVAELETQVRRIFLDGRDHPDDTFPAMVGHSIGTWDGDTLVIDTTLLEPWELRPWPRSDEAHAVERLYLTTFDQIEARPSGFVGELDAAISDEVLVVDITLTDPVYYDGPQRRIAYYQRVGDYDTAEYGCSRGLWQDLLDAQRIE